MIVTVELLRRNTAAARQTFTLRRAGGRWRVVFDTLLEEGIAAYVQNREAPGSARRCLRRGEGGLAAAADTAGSPCVRSASRPRKPRDQGRDSNSRSRCAR